MTGLSNAQSRVSNGQSRFSGLVGMLSAGLWLVGLFIEYRYGLQPPGDGSWMYRVDQGLFFIALAGFVVLLWGLWKSAAAGAGALGKISLGILIGGLISLLIAQLVQWLTHNPDFILFPVGGLFQLVGGLLTGVAVLTANRWDGWQKFAPLVQGLYYLIALFIPLALANQAPTQLGESLWQVTWFLTSLALYTKSGRT